MAGVFPGYRPLGSVLRGRAWDNRASPGKKSLPPQKKGGGDDCLPVL
jgi:hypothetical protein